MRGIEWLIEAFGCVAARLRDLDGLAALFRVIVDVFLPGERRSVRMTADCVIFAVPKHALRFIFSEAALLVEFQYAPWMVANLTLDHFPAERDGAPIAWGT